MLRRREWRTTRAAVFQTVRLPIGLLTNLLVLTLAVSCMVCPLTGLGLASADSAPGLLQQIDEFSARLNQAAADAAKQAGVGAFKCPLSVQQVRDALANSSGIRKFHQDQLSCTFLAGSVDGYFNGNDVRLEVDRGIGQIDGQFLKLSGEAAEMAHCGFKISSDTYGPTTFLICHPHNSPSGPVVLDALSMSFDTANHKVVWTLNLSYGEHVQHSEEDLISGIGRLLKAMA